MDLAYVHMIKYLDKAYRINKDTTPLIQKKDKWKAKVYIEPKFIFGFHGNDHLS